MRLTNVLSEPVLILLTKSPYRSQALFSELFKVKQLNIDFGKDKLNQTLKSSFESASSIDRNGCIFHFISVRNAAPQLSLLSIVDIDTENAISSVKKVQLARNHLANTIKNRTNRMVFSLKSAISNLLKSNLTMKDILGSDEVHLERIREKRDSNPISTEAKLSIQANDQIPSSMELREIVLPFDSHTSNLMKILENSNAERITTGLYNFGNLAIRPLPLGTLDIVISPPTLVFRCNSIAKIEESVKAEIYPESNKRVALHKVGRSCSNPGQLLIDIGESNLELRYCQASEFSSFFAEAQASLLASSLNELQNVNVLLEGGKVNSVESKSKLDVMNGLGDCWKEFRVSIRNPQGFVKVSKNKKVAKAPDIPYE